MIYTMDELLEDGFEVSGAKAWIEAMAIKIVEKKIADEDIKDVFEKINKRYKDKQAYKIISTCKKFFGRTYMVLGQMEREIKDGRPKKKGESHRF